VVIPCRTAHGQRAILKICPDRDRVAKEIAGLAHWSTPHVPTVLQTDPSMGALLMEKIEPGTPLQDSGTYPALSDLARLLTSLYTQGTPDPDLTFPSVAGRVDYLFASCGPWRDSNLPSPSPWRLHAGQHPRCGERLASTKREAGSANPATTNRYCRRVSSEGWTVTTILETTGASFGMLLPGRAL
jgi:hypothetical protein